MNANNVDSKTEYFLILNYMLEIKISLLFNPVVDIKN